MFFINLTIDCDLFLTFIVKPIKIKGNQGEHRIYLDWKTPNLATPTQLDDFYVLMVRMIWYNENIKHHGENVRMNGKKERTEQDCEEAEEREGKR